VGDNRVRKAKESVGGRAAGFTQSVGRKAGVFDNEVGRNGGSLARWG